MNPHQLRPTCDRQRITRRYHENGNHRCQILSSAQGASCLPTDMYVNKYSIYLPTLERNWNSHVSHTLVIAPAAVGSTCGSEAHAKYSTSPRIGLRRDGKSWPSLVYTSCAEHHITAEARDDSGRRPRLPLRCQARAKLKER